jgi:LCP family protein required for cell wall assembly
MDKKILLIIALIIISLACTIPIAALGIQGSGNPEIKMLADLDLSNDISPTPFQPYQYTPSVAPQSQLILDSLVPNEGVQRPEGQVNLLLLGSDWQTDRQSNNTDVILLVSIFTHEEKISLVSFPRDLWVEVPGVGEQRINTTQAYGGFPLTVNTFEYNFGIHLDHYIMTNLNGFISIISMLGKIEINAAKNLSDYCHLSHEQHRSWCSVGPGIEYLDSEMALWYVRSRYSTDDFDRTRRAQEVLEGIFKGLMSMDAITKAPELYDLFASSVVTDLTLNDILGLIHMAPKILADPSSVRRYTLVKNVHTTPHTIPTSGANVQLPNYDAIWQLLLEAVFTP